MKNPLRTFYIIIFTQTISIVGSSMTSLAIGIKVFKDSGEVTPLALVAFFSMLPRIITASFAGVMSDRWDRKKVIMLSDTGQAVGTLILITAFATDNFSLGMLYAIAMLQAVFSIFQDPAFNATVTMLVPDEKRDFANTLRQINGPMAGFIAPLLAGILFGVIGVTGVMAIDLITFLVAVAVISVVHIPKPTQTKEGQESKGSVWKESLSGYKFLLARRTLFYLLLYAMLLNFLFNMVGVLNTPYILSLTGSEATLGFVMAVQGIGPVVGGILFSMWNRKMGRVPVIFGAIILMGFFLSILGVVRTPILLAAMSFLMLFPNPAANALLMSLLQIKTPPDMQGRVFSAVMQLAMFATPLAYLIAGPLVDGILEPAVGTSAWETVEPILGDHEGAGIGLLMMINGAIVVITGLILYSWPRMRALEESLPDYIPAEIEEPTPILEEFPQGKIEASPAL